MRTHAVLSLCLTFSWLALTSTVMAQTTQNTTTTPTNNNVVPTYKGPLQQSVHEDTEHKMPISINDPDEDLVKVELTVKNGTLSATQPQTPASKFKFDGNLTKKMTVSSDEQVDINDTLKSLVYKGDLNYDGEDKLTVTSTDSNNNTETKVISIMVNEVSASSRVCDPTKTTSGGAQGFGGNWSAGPTLSYSLVQYNLADKKSSLNAQAAGAGISIRYYGNDQLANFGVRFLGRERRPKSGPGEPNKIYAEDTDITEVPSGCRAQTYDFYDEKKVHSWISFAPTMYAFQEKNADNFGVQFALNIGFLDDIFTIGAGWNLSGDNAGEWFILAGPSIGFGF